MISVLKNINTRRELLKYLVISDLKLSYANKVLGYFWSLLDPLALMAVYAILVSGIFNRGGPQFPVLVFSSILAWQWFNFSLSKSVISLSSKAIIIQTISFPLAILPLSGVITYLIRFLLGLLALIPMLFLYDATFTWNILWYPCLLIIQLLFTTGICFITAIAGVYFKDMTNIIQFLLRIWFYMSPILYSIEESVPKSYQAPLYILNPFAALFTSYKAILIRGTAPTLFIIMSCFISIMMFLIGLYVFSKFEINIAKDL